MRQYGKRLRLLLKAGSLHAGASSRDREYFTQLDVDAAQADATAGMLSTVLANTDLSATAVRDLMCRRTLCRLAVEHATRQDMGQLALLLPLQVGTALPQLTFFHEEGPAGRLHTVIYLTRQGHTLPILVQ